MSIRYQVQQGDCISSIAYAHGFLPKTLWQHSDNADLKQKRKDPNALAPGDVVAIPELQLKQESGATAKKHRFQKKGVPAKLKIRVLLNNEPRRNEKFKLCIDGRWSEGATDGDGFVEHSLPPDARNARLVIGEGGKQEILELAFGHVDPIDSDEGAAGRLHDLGYSTREGLSPAVRKFQADNSLRVTGELDTPTRDKLKQKFGQ